MNSEEDSRDTEAVVIHTSILAFAMVLSFIGNTFIIYALYRNRRLRTITNFYVASLALVDMMMAMLSFPFQVTASGLRKWIFAHNFCQLTGFVVQYWVQVSLSILTLASLNRYFCVVKP
ncbi:octopamine receptor beta-2R-like, partial [Stylophora pistillata]|uniref:octopamine receptor beta-2R-like n=1 Tax=Stylophora pistillata TaxID=50429 RepID=UPI000C04F00B